MLSPAIEATTGDSTRRVLLSLSLSSEPHRKIPALGVRGDDPLRLPWHAGAQWRNFPSMPLQRWPGRDPLQLCSFTRAKIWTLGSSKDLGSLDGETPNDTPGPTPVLDLSMLYGTTGAMVAIKGG